MPDSPRTRQALRRLASLDVLVPMPAPHNYPDPAGPRYAGGTPSRSAALTLSVVTFNVKFARNITQAIALLRGSAELRDPDVLLLQEMDPPGAQAIADALELAWVYYPSTVHPIARQDFGCAILSRFALLDDKKIIMPHLARLRRIQRAAVAATIDVGGRPVRVCNVHLSTMIDNGPRERREQLGPVFEDAARHERVIIAGDFNSDKVAGVALQRGFAWPTRSLGPTNALWAMDHVLLKGLSLAAPEAFGAVRDTFGASDHKPVWARIAI